MTDDLRIIEGDCRDVLGTLPSDSLFIVTDPPYGTGGWRRPEGGQGRNPKASLVSEEWDDGATDWLNCLPPTIEAVAAFWPAARTRALLEAADEVGLTKHRCLYMRKLDPKPQVGGRTKWSVEPIWVLSREGFVLIGGDDVFEASTPRLGRDSVATGHPYQKPLGVMVWLVDKFPPAATICDPFMGSGTTGVACLKTGRRFIGMENDPAYFQIAQRRLRDAATPLLALLSEAPIPATR